MVASVSFVRGHPTSKPRVERVWPAAGAAESTTIMHLPRTEYQDTMNRSAREAAAAARASAAEPSQSPPPSASQSMPPLKNGSRDVYRTSRGGKRRLCTRGVATGRDCFTSTTASAVRMISCSFMTFRLCYCVIMSTSYYSIVLYHFNIKLVLLFAPKILH